MSRQRILALVGAASLTLASCGVSMGGDAPLATISIGSTQTAEISQADGAEALAEIASSERFMQAVYSGSLTTADQQAVVTQLIRGEVLKAEAEKLGVSPSAEDIESARALLESQLVQVAASVDPGDSEIVAGEIRDELGTYFDSIAESVANENSVRELFSTQTEGGLPCSSHILVSPDDEALATDLVEQLNAGADFAQLAAEYSIDGSGANGGELGCVDPQTYVPEFRDAVISAEIGELVGPIKTDFGYHIIIVTGYEDTAAVQERVAALYEGVVVSVDPDFGMWDPLATAIVDTTAP